MSMANDDIENEGAIDTGDSAQGPSDNSGAAPVMSAPADNSGQPAIPPANMGAQPAQQPGVADPGFNPQGNGPLAPAARGIKSIVSYLMGAGASHPDSIDQAGAKIDPQGQMSPADRNLLAVDQAREQGGDQAAWQLLQANRVAYNAQTAFAKTALQGTQQKPADLRAAVDAANKAQANVLDGSNVQFAAGHQGVTATVTMAGTSQPQTINLTPQQFGQFLDVGGDGQWDKIMDHSAPATLQRIASSGGGAPQRQGAKTLAELKPVPKAQPYVPDNSESDAYQPPSPTTNFGKTPSTLNLSGSDEPNDPRAAANDAPAYDPELVKRGQRMFPSTSQQAQRDQWMNAQEQRQDELQNKIDVENAKGTFRVQGADVTGKSREAVAKTAAGARVESAKTFSKAKTDAALASLQSHIQQQEAAGTRNARTLAEKGLAALVMSGQTDKMTPQQKSMWEQITTNTPEPAAQRPQAPAQQAAPQAPQRSAQPQMSAHDQQAAAWAKANPNDPRAAQINQKLGVQ